MTGLQPEAMHLLFPAAGSVPREPQALDLWLAAAADQNLALRIQRTRAALAIEESAKYSARASTNVDLVAQVGQDRLTGSGDFGPASVNSNTSTIGIQVSVPLYTGGLRSARRDEALHLADKAHAEADRTIDIVANSATTGMAATVTARWLIVDKLGNDPACEHRYIHHRRREPMKVNVGTLDRIVRLVAGVSLIGLAAAGAVGPWGYLGIIPLLTGFVRVCPAYGLLGITTCGTGKA